MRLFTYSLPVGVHKPIVFIAFCVLLLVSRGWAQTDIPLGSWRAHISYNSVNIIALSNTKVFAATKNGIAVLEKSSNELFTYSKLNGLSGTGISYISCNPTTEQLAVGYDDGTIDIIKDNTVTNFDRLSNSASINGSKRINHIAMRLGYAYIATDYGLVVFDLNNVEVKETWRDLGSNGSKLKIYQSAFKGDSIFLATEKGVLAGNLNTNLLDYNSWKRFDKNSFNSAVQSIAIVNDNVYAAINNSGIYNYKGGAWNKKTFLQNLNFSSVNASASSLLITENKNLWKLNAAEELTQIVDGSIVQPFFALEESADKYWIGDGKQGLISNAQGSFLSYIPNGPVNATCLQLKHSNNSIYALPGGYSSSFLAMGNDKGFDFFTNGQWQNRSTEGKDLTDATFNSIGNYFVSSFGYGLEERNENGVVQLYNENNSPLINANPPGRFVNITAIENTSVGVWVANYGVTNSLHLLKKDNLWESFSFPGFTAARYPVEIAIDYNGYVWMLLSPTQGGGILVFDRVNNKTKYLTDQAGSGTLPSKIARAITIDRDGYVWIGTDSGIAYFSSTNTIFSSTPDAIKPILENRYLLKDEKVTCIKVDGANRKWVGTEKGAWLFGSTGEQYVYNFTEENSPLLSNKIQNIEIDPTTGEVFFATDKGIVSYRSNATQGNEVFGSVKIFPNPVTSNFTGNVGISGLATDAIVKITDISGKLIWQTQAQGGTATWNVKDYNGHHAATGVYVVYAATQDGTEATVGKIAVIE